MIFEVRFVRLDKKQKISGNFTPGNRTNLLKPQVLKSAKGTEILIGLSIFDNLYNDINQYVFLGFEFFDLL